MAKERYFIAIVPPDKILQEVEKLKQDLLKEHSLKGSLRSPAHITLHMPFEWEETKEVDLINHLSTFHFGKSFHIDLENFGCFEPKVIFLAVNPTETLQTLYISLRHHMKQIQIFNEAENPRGFHPHMTIAFRDLKKNKFPLVWQQFQNQSFSANFQCSAFYLLKLREKWEILQGFDI